VLPKNPTPRGLLAVLISIGILLLAAPAGWPGSPDDQKQPAPSQKPAPTPVTPPPAPASGAGLISTGSAVRGGPAPDLVLFFEGEVMGWTEPCG